MEEAEAGGEVNDEADSWTTFLGRQKIAYWITSSFN